MEIKYVIDLKNYLLQDFFLDFGLMNLQNFELVEVKLCQGNKANIVLFTPTTGKKKSVNELVSRPPNSSGKKYATFGGPKDVILKV